jgi:outer membrane protein assembly factor BamE (lipoprotein component of BamABCDE complex)
MTQEQVRDLLGEPDKVDAGGTLTFWYFGLPVGGMVHFHSATNRLDGWTEPTRTSK